MRRIQDTNVGPGPTFISRDSGTNTPGTRVRREYMNDTQEEVCRGIESAGIAVDTTLYTSGTGDRDQLTKMIAHYGAGGASFYVEDVSSAANAYVLNTVDLGIRTRQGPPDLFDGMRAVADIADNNTGAGTLNVNATGAKSYKTKSGIDPAADEIQGRVTFEYKESTDVWVIIETGTGATGITDYPPGHKDGLNILRNGADTKDLDISAGTARDDDDTLNIVLATGLTKQGDATWTAGDAAGGVASAIFPLGASPKWVALHAVGNNTVSDADVIIDDNKAGTNVAADVGGSGFTVQKFIGWRLWDGAQFTQHFKVDGKVLLDGVILDYQGLPSTTGTAHAMTLPPDDEILGIVDVTNETTSTPGGQAYGIITAIRQANSVPSITNHNVVQKRGSADTHMNARGFELPLDNLGQIRERFDVGTNIDLRLFAVGWREK